MEYPLREWTYSFALEVTLLEMEDDNNGVQSLPSAPPGGGKRV